MRKKLSKKYRVCIISILLLLLVIGCISSCHRKNLVNNDNTLNISITRITQVLKENISEREITLKSSEIFVGNTKKEIENGYYDIKIYKENDVLKIHINKLWKEFNSNLYENKYVSELANSISKLVGISSYNDLEDYILEGYKKAKDLDENEAKNNEYYLNQNNITIKRNIKDKELILIICKEVKNEN